jgi:ATP-dependent Clp protease, protease subunit
MMFFRNDDMDRHSPNSGGNEIVPEAGIYYFSSEFNLNSVRDVNSWILECNFQGDRKYSNLTIIFSSYGGDLYSSFALIDMMRGSRIPIHTVGLGIIASAALMAFIAGEKGYRTITPNTSILSHQWSAGTYGKEHELVASQKQFDLTTRRMINHYRKTSKLPEKVIREKLLPAQDVWLTAEEALEYNLADNIRDLK